MGGPISTMSNANRYHDLRNLHPFPSPRTSEPPGGGYVFSPQDQGGNDAVDSDANTTTGVTAPETLASRETNLTVEAGLYKKAALGDFVWDDTNANGIQDAGKLGIPHVTVTLNA